MYRNADAVIRPELSAVVEEAETAKQLPDGFSTARLSRAETRAPFEQRFDRSGIVARPTIPAVFATVDRPGQETGPIGQTHSPWRLIQGHRACSASNVAQQSANTSREPCQPP